MEASKMADAAAAAVDDRALVALLQEMVRIRSYSAGGEEGTIARFMQSRLSALGLEVELQEVQPGRFNCISRWRGRGGGQSLMLNGHLDTNPAGEGWTKDPFGGAEIKHVEGDVVPGNVLWADRGGIESAVNIGSEQFYEIVVELKD